MRRSGPEWKGVRSDIGQVYRRRAVDNNCEKEWGLVGRDD